MREWRTVVGWSEYEVSDTGLVRRGEHQLTGWVEPESGYRIFHLRQDSKSTAKRVHVLVAEAFLGPRPRGLVVRHRNGLTWDTSVENIAYGTVGQNRDDAVRHGTDHNARLLTCRRDHLLREPNLVPSKRGRNGAPARACLACSRGRANVQHAAQRGETLDLREEADRHYMLIMGLQAPRPRVMGETDPPSCDARRHGCDDDPALRAATVGRGR